MTGSLKGVRIAVDAMGGDFGVSVAVAGSVAASRRYGLSLVLVGREALVKAELAKAEVKGLDIRVVDALELAPPHPKTRSASAPRRFCSRHEAHPRLPKARATS